MSGDSYCARMKGGRVCFPVKFFDRHVPPVACVRDGEHGEGVLVAVDDYAVCQPAARVI